MILRIAWQENPRSTERIPGASGSFASGYLFPEVVSSTTWGIHCRARIGMAQTGSSNAPRSGRMLSKCIRNNILAIYKFLFVTKGASERCAPDLGARKSRVGRFI